MINFKTLVFILCVLVILSSCGTKASKEIQSNKDNQQNQNGETLVAENLSGWNTIDIVSNRPIIAKLEQTKKDTSKRDKAIYEVMETREFKDGLLGEPTQELAEALSIQHVEGSIVIPALIEIYGGREEFDQEGVIFFENKPQGAEQSGLWIGVKRPDDRLKQFLDEMQQKVDAGEIKAENIFIYYTPHTSSENDQLTDNVSSAVNELLNKHETPNRGSYSISTDTVTGDVHIDHNFLTEEQKEKLVAQFPNETILFKQSGRMVPKDGEPDTIYPDVKYTEQISKEGSYVIEVSEDKMLVIAASPEDYSKTGGQDEFYSATYYNFPNASNKLKVGQRVVVDESGPIMLSYPGQGTALYVEVLPEYKPQQADLSESQVVAKSIEKVKENKNMIIPAIQEISYNEETDYWNVKYKLDDENDFDVEMINNDFY